jgi:hypothetical protein
MRYDKAQILTVIYHKSFFSIILEKAEDIIFRVFSNWFRNPTTQDQYIGFNVGSAVLIGSAPDNL